MSDRDKTVDELNLNSELSADELRGIAAGIAALNPDHPDRIAFDKRSRGDEECQTRLHQGQRLMALLATLPAPPEPSRAMLQRVSDEITSDMQRESRPPWALAAGALASVLCWWFALVLTDHILVGPSLWLSLFAVAALGAVAVLVSRSGGLAALGAIGASAVIPPILATVPPTELCESFVGCTTAALVCGIAPLFVVALCVARGYRIASSPMSFAGVAALGALGGQIGLHAACPDVSLAHIYPWHFGAVVLAAGIGCVTAYVPWIKTRFAESNPN